MNSTLVIPTQPYIRERNLILGALILVAAVAWAFLLWQTAMMDEEAMGLTMGMGAPVFIASWVAMMVAVMLPAAAPMISTFARIQARRQEEDGIFVPTWLFVGSYFALWLITAFAAYGAAAFADDLTNDSIWLMDIAARIGGGILLLAGAYQLSPLKWNCLFKCRRPATFLLRSWQVGRRGAIRMGLEHGRYCLGCCWMLFVILAPLGLMNVAAMAVIAALIFAEKSFSAGPRIAQAAAIALIAWGAIVIAYPSALPTML